MSRANESKESPSGESAARQLQRLRRLSRTMDSRFRLPGTDMRFGLDPIIGLIPGVGDWIGAGISAYPIVVARRLGLPGHVQLRMGWNVLLEATVGAIPLLGDVFDFGFRSNKRNVDLLERALVKRGLIDPPTKSKG